MPADRRQGAALSKSTRARPRGRNLVTLKVGANVVEARRGVQELDDATDSSSHVSMPACLRPAAVTGVAAGNSEDEVEVDDVGGRETVEAWQPDRLRTKAVGGTHKLADAKGHGVDEHAVCVDDSCARCAARWGQLR